jgi:hypothetical protein
MLIPGKHYDAAWIGYPSKELMLFSWCRMHLVERVHALSASLLCLTIGDILLSYYHYAPLILEWTPMR